jgi:hypothetical protein
VTFIVFVTFVPSFCLAFAPAAAFFAPMFTVLSSAMIFGAFLSAMVYVTVLLALLQ